MNGLAFFSLTDHRCAELAHAWPPLILFVDAAIYALSIRVNTHEAIPLAVTYLSFYGPCTESFCPFCKGQSKYKIC